LAQPPSPPDADLTPPEVAPLDWAALRAAAEARAAEAAARRTLAQHRIRVRQGSARSIPEAQARLFAEIAARAPLTVEALNASWEAVVGDKLARLCWPDKIGEGKGGRTLTVRAPGVAAPLVQHAAPILLERLNHAHAKARFVRLSVVHAAGPRPRISPKPPVAPVRPTAPVPPDPALAQVEDPSLRAVLERLHKAVMGG
jgi:hypothetical protein